MKSLEELYEEARKNPELVSAFMEAMEKNQIEGFLKEQGCSASPEEAQTFLAAQMGKTQALSDEELDNVAGGKDASSGSAYSKPRLPVYRCPKCKKVLSKTEAWKAGYICPQCGGTLEHWLS